MTHRTPSPEDRFNAYLDALASGKSTPEASDAVADLSADSSMPAETARELHDLARAADARQGDPPDSIWESIMHATAATAPPLSPETSPEQPASSKGIRIVPIERPRRRPTRPFAWLNAVAAAVLLLGLAAGWYFSSYGPAGDGDDSGHLAALPAMQTGSPDASVAASPVATNEADGLMVIEGNADEARIENGVRIATLGDDGLTLPVGGEIVRHPDVISAGLIYGVPGVLHVIHADDTEAVIDIATGEVRFNLPSFQSWARGFGRWQFVPTDDTLTDWTTIDMGTGETRLLSELIDLPDDTSVLPHELTPGIDSTAVIEVVPVTIKGTRLNPSGPAIATFVAAGSLDRVATLPDYPTPLDNVGEPTLVSSAEGDVVAYETREGDDRLVILDTATGDELGRYDVDAVGDNPTLAGFRSRSLSDLVITTDDGRVMQLVPDGGQALVLHEGLEGIDNPLLIRDGSALYVRQVDRLLMLEMLPDGFVREVATGLVPGRFGFTTPRGNMIVAQTQDGHIMVDARTGEVVSRMKAPANVAPFADAPLQPGWFGVADEDEVVIFAIAIAPMPPTAPPDAAPAAWLLSTDFPDGLEVTAPEDTGTFWLSPNGETLYAFAREGSGGPGTVWATPLGTEPDWQPIVEDVTPLATLFVGMMLPLER